MTFNIIQNTFDQAADFMHALELVNDEYDVRFYYMGDSGLCLATNRPIILR